MAGWHKLLSLCARLQFHWKYKQGTKTIRKGKGYL